MSGIPNSLFGRPRHQGVRVVVTGQVGVDKKAFLEEVLRIARERGHELTLCNIGDMMYREAPDIVPGRILDLPRTRLNTLRRAVFKDVISLAERTANVIVNTHATFRWKHGLFEAFDFDHMTALDADLYVTLVDNVDAVHERLLRDHELTHTLKDIMVWREEEILATEILSHSIGGHGKYYVLARGALGQTASSLVRLMFEPQRKKIYPSFPMSHVMDMPDVLAEIDAFRDALAEHFICFDPGDLDEKRLLFEAAEATKRGEQVVSIKVNGRVLPFNVTDVASVARDIDSQIYARDFKLIDQSDMIVSYIPELPGGIPGLSAGVERELQHAFEGTKEAYVIWRPKKDPSPFTTETATRVFRSVDELFKHFQSKGYLGDYQLDLIRSSGPKERGRFG
ncbi:MAG TPA: AAA family ATPase [Phycisphaerae bacterium]|nr:AAA family ATPase [Phycisphaerae bacterium]